MDENIYPEIILQSFPSCSGSCLCMAKDLVSNPPHDPYSEETEDGALLQYYQLQDNFYRHQDRLPRTSISSILADDQGTGRSSSDHHAFEEILTRMFAEICGKLSERIRKLGLKINLELVNYVVPTTTRKRGRLNVGWSWASTVHFGPRHRHDQDQDQDHGMLKLERFKIKTLNVLVEGDAKKTQK